MKSDIRIIEPSGILDGTQGESFRQEVDDAIADGADMVLIDLKNVTFVDSSGLGILVVVLKKVRAAQKEMYFCSINDQVRMLFELTSMDRVFEVLPNRIAFEEKMTSLSSV
ncbi:STAS domain-containing protein [Oscillatoria sp. CS-180]|uniref:STAS domain-containing protein n=1 Tax=Oscillatoria sp. CS-180 TaxID=3021720 RepID=UPI00232B487F|nr:STAS domain-containing protein [Oscillatoria sp. CS-180]MDB9529846.1 STAS domain-containing protein [Oscillatoria sp. CS-180]